MGARKIDNLIVKSYHQAAISAAHDKAKALALFVSPITKNAMVENSAFIILPRDESVSAMEDLLEAVAHQKFIDWCESENNKVEKATVNEKKISKLDLLRISNE